ncbi:NADPH:quinone oxidoreductase family protein [Azospirillum doebereinerae]|uniref:NADPH:quinone oxidoreductase family protein n=1 Tax=Azospirillum doebereinerae TaxID=92933 RepID=A0A3S0XI16_9PROT|nr:NADPH:quinone oxidoreductase family protein [Azospirillum doebereinerae]MCG5239935.1 NADPH:quinone oxidoreductase family protein [Azospirillum doebereinerae]RUQ61030.1 NADPH:quinone oxidoreductase family protein [Azospirillum doebereinerae]
MRAITIRQFGEPDSMTVEERPTPQAGPNEVLVSVKSIGVNYPDLLVIGGKYQILAKPPFSPGKDAAGVVLAVGSGVEVCKPGDRVVCQLEYGAYAEEIVVPAAQCFVLPDAMSFDEAAAMGLAYQTAHFALVERGMYRKGETVLVNGAAGGVGLAAVQIAKGLGATVIAGVIGEDQAAIARENGADHTVDLTMPDLRNALRDRIKELTGGHGVDVALDPVGGEAFTAALRAMAWRGRMVVIGFVSGTIPEVKVNYLLVKNIHVSGLQWSDYRDRTPDWVRRVQTELFDLYESGAIRPKVMESLPFEDYARALQMVRDGKVTGKVVLRV